MCVCMYVCKSVMCVCIYMHACTWVLGNRYEATVHLIKSMNMGWNTVVSDSMHVNLWCLHACMHAMHASIGESSVHLKVWIWAGTQLWVTVCMYVCMYVNLWCVSVYICMHAREYWRIVTQQPYAQEYAYGLEHSCEWLYVCMYVCKSVMRVCVYTHACIHACMHVSIGESLRSNRTLMSMNVGWNTGVIDSVYVCMYVCMCIQL